MSLDSPVTASTAAENAETTTAATTAAAARRTAPPLTREEVASFFPASYYYGGYYYDDFGYDGPYSVGSDGRTHRVCRHFLQGRCTWGSSCRFSHDVGQPLTGDTQEVVPPPPAFYGTFPPPPPPPPPNTEAHPPPSNHNTSGDAVALEGSRSEASPSAVPHHAGDSNEFLAYQQATLQARRHAVLVAALKANFQIRQLPEDTDAGSRRGQVTLTTLTNVPNIVIDVLEEDEVAAQLDTIQSNPRVASGGLHYLVGEATLFWSMMRLWHVNGRTGSSQWDALLDAAHNGAPVACMFYCSTVGCAVGRCAYRHTAAPLEVPPLETLQPTAAAVGEGEGARAKAFVSATTTSDDASGHPPPAPPPTTVAEGW